MQLSDYSTSQCPAALQQSGLPRSAQITNPRHRSVDHDLQRTYVLILSTVMHIGSYSWTKLTITCPVSVSSSTHASNTSTEVANGSTNPKAT